MDIELYDEHDEYLGKYTSDVSPRVGDTIKVDPIGEYLKVLSVTHEVSGYVVPGGPTKKDQLLTEKLSRLIVNVTKLF